MLTEQVKNKTTQFLQHLEPDVQQRQTGSPAWLKSVRKASLDAFRAHGIPSIKNEEWKYTSLSGLPESLTIPEAVTVLRAQKQLDDFISPDTTRIVLINGHLVEDMSNYRHLEKHGISVRSLATDIDADGAVQAILQTTDFHNSNIFSALNTALLDDGVVITVPKNVHYAPTIHVVNITETGDVPAILSPRNIIMLGQASETTVLETHLNYRDDAVYLANPVTDITIAENAILHYSKAQDESLQAWHIGNTRVRVARNGMFDGFSLMIGGNVTRNDIDVIIQGEGATAILNGLYSSHGSQHVDNHTSIDHLEPCCQSSQLYKGILNDAAHSVFNGKIYVRAIAQKTNSYQLNKNLLLGADCRVDTKPQLEIFADDVKCTHGATIGQLDATELFYLQTRGVARSRAIQMLCRGFVDDILGQIAQPEVQEYLARMLEPTFAHINA